LENHHLEWVNHGKSTVNEPFSIAMLNYRRVPSLLIWKFPEMWVHPVLFPFLFGVFHEINHPAIGLPPFMETSICDIPQ